MSTFQVKYATPLARHRAESGQRQRAHTRNRIINCAIPIFAAYGADNPTVDDFVKAAGVSRGSFYNYFKTTEELLSSTYEVLSNEIIAAIVPAVADVSNPIVRFATAARIYYHWATSDPTVAAFLSKVSQFGTLAEHRVKLDLQEAIESKLTDIEDLEVAFAVASGVMVFALRAHKVNTHDDNRGILIVNTILKGLGVSESLRKKALSVKLPDLPVAGGRWN
jgi:AcrR family transcriptional regulator